MATTKAPNKKEEKKNEIGSKNTGSLAWKVIMRPYISEKSTSLEKENKYVFEVSEKTNKDQVKKAIEELYGVDVLNVNIINVVRKRKKLGRHSGWKKGFKKAIIKLKEGDHIDAIAG